MDEFQSGNVREPNPEQRRPSITWPLGLVVAAMLAGSCASPALPGPSVRSLGSSERWLQTIPPNSLCAGGGTVGEVRLHGSPTDSGLAWMTLPDGTRRPLIWQPGTSARFGPDLEVIGPDGVVVAREGSRITGNCAFAPTGADLPEFGSSAP